jgi:hypothetical protein
MEHVCIQVLVPRLILGPVTVMEDLVFGQGLPVMEDLDIQVEHHQILGPMWIMLPTGVLGVLENL